MHPSPVYRKPDSARNLAFARKIGFGVLTLAGPEGPLISHIPFVLDEAGALVGAHLFRANPILAQLKAGPVEAAIAVTGPNGYISPDWYGVDDQVPTWNYVAVHLRGQLRVLDQGKLRGHLDMLSARFEADLSPKTPWTTGKMDAEVLTRMEQMIAPVEMVLSDVAGTWKLSQNKADEVRMNAADGLTASGAGTEIEQLRALMRGV